MPLLGWPLLLTLGILLAAVMVGTLVLWGRVRGPLALRISQRLGLLVAVQLVATLLTAAAVNNYGYFYGSWSDLLGGGGGVGQIHAVDRHTLRHVHVAPDPRLGFVADTSWSTPSHFATKGELATATVRGMDSGLSSPVSVYLPPQYFAAGERHTDFPVVEAVAGFPGTAQGLVERMGYQQDELAQSTGGRARPAIIVMVASAVEPQRDTECTNVPGGPQVETFLDEDVPATIRSTFRVTPYGWGIIGDSTGGYCAVKLAMARPDLYHAAVAMSGYYHTYRARSSGELWGGSKVYERLQSPEWLLRHEPAPPVRVLVSIGSREGGAYGIKDTHRFLSLVRYPMSASVIVIRNGGHNFADWQQVVPKALDWLSPRITEPAVRAGSPVGKPSPVQRTSPVSRTSGVLASRRGGSGR